jgi:CheY-like chemotaxis protein
LPNFITVLDVDLRAFLGPRAMPSCGSGDGGEDSLPASEDDGQSESEALVRIRAGRPRVLVVDDEDLFREGLVSMLSEVYASQVDSAADAGEALEKARSGFDLVLMDVTMPGMDGFEAFRKMRAQALAMQVVLMTANKSEERGARAQALGVPILGKPIEPEDLERILLACLGGGPS